MLAAMRDGHMGCRELPRGKELFFGAGAERALSHDGIWVLKSLGMHSPTCLPRSNNRHRSQHFPAITHTPIFTTGARIISALPKHLRSQAARLQSPSSWPQCYSVSVSLTYPSGNCLRLPPEPSNAGEGVLWISGSSETSTIPVRKPTLWRSFRKCRMERWEAGSWGAPSDPCGRDQQTPW